MFFKTGQVCPDCNVEIMVYPASVKMGVINGRSLPGWKRCECRPYRLHEISTAEFDSLVPDWQDRLAPVDPLDPDCSLEEAIDSTSVI